MKFEVGSATDQGIVREENQDSFLLHGNFVAVADGMGGHAGGELAAETAVEELRRFPTMVDGDDVVEGIHHANRQVLSAAERTGMTNMGTTVVAALLRPERRSVTVANVGDSRAYFFHRSDLDQITQDHSLVEDLVRAGKISEEEAKDHPHRNVVTRVLGIGEDPQVDTFELAVQSGDMFLLASDGLFNEVDHHVLATILDNADDLDEAAERLVERANQNGGHDNITVVVARITDDEPVAGEPASALAIANGDEDTTQVFHAVVADADLPTQTFVAPEPAGEDDPRSSEAAETLLGTEASTGPVTDEIPVVSPRRSSRLRNVIFALCVLALLGLGAGGLFSYARNAWFVQTVGSEVVIHQGRPGGLLFIQPQVVKSTGININDLNPESRGDVADVPVFSTLGDAETFVEELQRSTLRQSE